MLNLLMKKKGREQDLISFSFQVFSTNIEHYGIVMVYILTSHRMNNCDCLSDLTQPYKKHRKKNKEYVRLC